jgi:hypothetical protein
MECEIISNEIIKPKAKSETTTGDSFDKREILKYDNAIEEIVIIWRRFDNDNDDDTVCDISSLIIFI